MFCAKCGSQIPDGAAFCGKCGNPIKSEQRPSAATPSAPVLSQKNSSYIPTTSGQATGQKREIDKGKIVKEIIAHIIEPFIVTGAAILVTTLGLIGMVNDYGASFSIGDFPGIYKAMIGASLLSSFLSVILKGIVIKLRINDPTDTEYEIGSMQDKETDEKFRKKYQLFESITEWVIIIVAIIFFFYSCYVEFRNEYSAEFQYLETMVNSQFEHSNSEDFQNDGTNTIAQGSISDTTYFVDNTDYGSIIILEPDGTCAYLVQYATGMSYYYGNYGIAANNIALHLTLDDGSMLDLPFAYNEDMLMYIGTEATGTYPNAVYNKSEGIPELVQFNPPYSTVERVSKTSYYVESAGDFRPEYTPTIILEPNGTCAFLVNYGSGMSYSYGQYEMTPNGGVLLTLQSGDGGVSIIEMESTANGFYWMSEGNLGLSSTGSRFYYSEEMPSSAQNNLPYSENQMAMETYQTLAWPEGNLPIPDTSIEAEEYVRAYLNETFPDVSAPIECISMDDYSFYISLNPDGMDTYAIIIDRGTGGIYAIDGFGGVFSVVDWYNEVGYQYVP